MVLTALGIGTNKSSEEASVPGDPAGVLIVAIGDEICIILPNINYFFLFNEPGSEAPPF